jgi:hypothetical protein
MKMNKLVNLGGVKLCMMVAVIAIVFGVAASSSYGQNDSCVNNTVFCNESTGYQIGGGYVLAQPGGSGDTAVGLNALVGGNTSSFATAVGSLALESNTTGEFNTATGNSALQFSTTGNHNTADGTDALAFNTTGGDNTAMGYAALESSTGTGGNTAVGYVACTKVTTATGVICIGSGVVGANISNSTYISGIHGRPTTGTNNPEVCVSSNGKLGTINCAPNTAQQEQIQIQAQQIADLQQRLSQLESLIAKK